MTTEAPAPAHPAAHPLTEDEVGGLQRLSEALRGDDLIAQKAVFVLCQGLLLAMGLYKAHSSASDPTLRSADRRSGIAADSFERLARVPLAAASTSAMPCRAR